MDRHAPKGKVWVCMMCGKTTKDCYGEERGWDASCALNCILVDEATKQPTEEQCREFSQERERRLQASAQRIRDLTESIRNGTWKPDPELLRLAEEALAKRDSLLPSATLPTTTEPLSPPAYKEHPLHENAGTS